MLRAPSQRPNHYFKRKSEMKLLKVSVAGLFALISSASFSADLATLQSLPLLTMDKWEYVGGFRIPADTYGESNITYSEGPIAMGAGGKSIYIVSHTYQQAIGEFSVPALVNSLKVSDFQYAGVVQNFSRVLGRPQSGNPQNMDRIGGMAYVNGQLLVNTYIYYDGGNVGTNTTLVVKNAANLAGSGVAGYHSYSARAHAAGWLSRIPSDWQSELGGTYIAGSSSGQPIISRWSVGPSAFVFDPEKTNYSSLGPSAVPMTKLLDYSLDNVMGVGTQTIESYLNNSTLKNSLWDHLSRATYGFVVPGTRTYMTVGFNGGMTSGVGYKITQDDGNLCGGYCAYKAADYSNYYWLFDMNDLLKVKAGQMNSYDVKPYAYGKLDRTTYANTGFNPIIGAAFDESTNRLYLSLERGDVLPYSGWAPSIVAFKLNVNVPSPPLPPTNPSATVIGQ